MLRFVAFFQQAVHAFGHHKVFGRTEVRGCLIADFNGFSVQNTPVGEVETEDVVFMLEVCFGVGTTRHVGREAQPRD